MYGRGIRTECVRLPSGLNIGKEALLDLGSPYLRPRVVVKFNDGKPLLPGDAWPFFATETTVHGLALEADQRDDFWFAWRRDTGIVLKSQNPDQYDAIVADAGVMLGGITIDVVGPKIVMMELQKDIAYRNQKCLTRWVTW